MDCDNVYNFHTSFIISIATINFTKFIIDTIIFPNFIKISITCISKFPKIFVYNNHNNIINFQFIASYLIKLALVEGTAVDYSVFKIDPQNFGTFCKVLLGLGIYSIIVCLFGCFAVLQNNEKILLAVSVILISTFLQRCQANFFFSFS